MKNLVPEMVSVAESPVSVSDTGSHPGAIAAAPANMQPSPPAIAVQPAVFASFLDALDSGQIDGYLTTRRRLPAAPG